jgi:hypothetical protein
LSNPFTNWTEADVARFNARGQPLPKPGDDAELVEADLHAKIFNECRRRGWIAFHGSMADRTCRTLGEPDFVILREAGELLMVECKSKSGKLSLEQHAMIAHAEKLGHKINVVWSFAEFLNLI